MTLSNTLVQTKHQDAASVLRAYLEQSDEQGVFHIDVYKLADENQIPVKTIGDAVMGSFVDGRHAIIAAIEAQQTLRSYYQNRPEKERIEVKIGIHSGPTILVTLNNRLDYFGTTVNMAARIQAIAQPNEIILSEHVFAPSEHKRLLRKYVPRVYRSTHAFKGLDGVYQVYHVRP